MSPEDQAVPDTVLPVGGAFRRGEGFEAVLEEFGPLIHSVAHRYAGDADEEEDLYQEACIRIYEQ